LFGGNGIWTQSFTVAKHVPALPLEPGLQSTLLLFF
jgi:hypothetical protein